MTAKSEFYTALWTKLHIGMTNDEVNTFISELKTDKNRFVGTGFDTIGSECIKSKYHCFGSSDESILRLYGSYFDRYPYDTLKTVNIGTPYRYVDYWNSPTGQSRIYLFFDENTNLLRGWLRPGLKYSNDKFMHEKLTSQLKWSEGGLYKGMTHGQVYALIGQPEEIIATPKESREINEDYFWVVKPNLDLAKQKIAVYSYLTSSGKRRHVYLLYYPAADELNSWGYDLAWDEAERYQHETAIRKTNEPSLGADAK